MKSLIITLVLAVVAYLGYYFYITPNYTTGEKAYDFSWQIDGESMALSDLRGDYVLLDFWGSWCPPCRKENPDLVKLYNRFHREGNPGFKIVSVGLETNEKRWKAAIQKDGLLWPHHFTDLKRMKSPVAIEYGVKEIPTKFLINPEGVIVLVNPSIEELIQRLTRELE